MVLDALSLGHRVRAQLLSRVRLFATPWTVAHQALLLVGFPRPESWSGLPCPPPGDLPASPALTGGCFTTEPPRKPLWVLQQAPAPGGDRVAPQGQIWDSNPETVYRVPFSHVMLCLDGSAHSYHEEIYVQSTTDKIGSPCCGRSEWRKCH